MILQSLVNHYDTLSKDQSIELAPYGYCSANISYALEISLDGQLLNILPQFIKVQRGKKEKDVPQPMLVPQQVKKTVNIVSNFLWENAAFVLGISNQDDEKPEYAKERFKVFKEKHTTALSTELGEPAQALLNFLENHDPEQARNHPVISKILDDLLKGGNLVFIYKGRFLHTEPSLKKRWDEIYAESESDILQCLVTGEYAPFSRLSPNLKGIRGGKSMGSTLVGFNASAYESYNHQQGRIAPISEKATFKYTTVLNYLLSDANPNQKIFLGDTTIVYWAETENRQYEQIFYSIFAPDYVDNTQLQSGRELTESTLKDVGQKVRKAQLVDIDGLMEDLKEENPRFYILGIAPNAARASVRFFINDPFLSIVNNIRQHYEDMRIEKEFEDQPDQITVKRMVNETVSKKSKDKDASPLLAGAVFRAILTNSDYPAALYYAMINRIRADMDDPQKQIKKVNYIRVATIKAYLTRKYRNHKTHPIKEALTMSLNEKSTHPAYVLGRLFAVLEKVQKEAIGEMNASIKDRYFTSACAAPASVFPVLLRLSQHHITKAEYGYIAERRMAEIMELLDIENNPIPSRLSLDEQGAFVLGYYHQRSAFYKTKNENKETE